MTTRLTAVIDRLDRFNHKLLWLCKWLTIFVVGILAINVFIGVFWRYVLNDSLPWYEESSKYLHSTRAFLAKRQSPRTRRPVVLESAWARSIASFAKASCRRLN